MEKTTILGRLTLTGAFAPKDYTVAIGARFMAPGWGDVLDRFQNFLYLVATYTPKYVGE